MGTSLEDLDDERFVCRLIASHHCESCGGEGRLYTLHRRNPRWKTDRLHGATSLKDLSAIPGHRQYSIRINDQFRVCFEWKNGDAWNVEIVDYH
jgi:proteic killer suppression protein